MNQINTSEVYPICDILNAYEDVQVQVKKLFEQFIRDKSIPLDDRWAIFVNSLDSLKNHYEWIIQWVSPEIEDGMQYEGGIMYWEKCETVKAERAIEAMWEYISEDNFHEITEEMISSEMEMLLSKNIGSYCYDW